MIAASVKWGPLLLNWAHGPRLAERELRMSSCQQTWGLQQPKTSALAVLCRASEGMHASSDG